MTALGVEEPCSGRLATADADLPSLSYGHLLGDSAGPARRGQQVRVIWKELEGMYEAIGVAR